MNVFPYPLIDGIIQPTWSSYQSFLSAYEERKAIGTNYSLLANVEGNGIDFETTITVGQINANNENKVLHVVLTESHIPESWYGGDWLHYVQRLMIPDQYGTPLLSKPSFDFNFSLDPDWVLENTELVYFIQDTITKEIFQAKTFSMTNAVLTHYDVAIEEIINPGDEYCEELLTPEIVIRNFCHENLTSCLISYEINGDLYEYNWEGDLLIDSVETVTLPEVAFSLQEVNGIEVYVGQPNGEEDQNTGNDTINKTFYQSQIIEKQQLVLALMTDDFGNETSWEIKDSQGSILANGDNFENNTLYTIPIDFVLDDCYEFIIYDEGGNGICCDNGDGYYQMKDNDGNIYFEGANFEFESASVFQVDIPTAINLHNNNHKVTLFPNPASDFISMKSDAEIITVRFYNTKGEHVIEESVNSKFYKFNTRQLLPGLYFVKIETLKETVIRRIVVQ